MIRSLITAFQMYSRIPMPTIEWKPENRRYALCFFPLVGTVIGVMFMIWEQICAWLGVGSFLFGAGALFITVLVTGGIHLDGFCDTCDARASWGDKPRRLEILSDSHIGAFAAIKLGVYLILYTALLSESYRTSVVAVIACGYVLSRSLSGFAAVTFKAAKIEGSLFDFTSNTHKNVALFVLSFTSATCCCFMLATNVILAISSIVAALITMIYYHHMAYKEFGGVTGDLAGWFLQVCELSVAAAAVVTYRIMEVIT